VGIVVAAAQDQLQSFFNLKNAMFNPINYYPSVAPAVQKVGFWKRQFQPSRTDPQLVFDLSFGIVGPVLCFYFDPIVFQGGFVGGEPLFPTYQVFVYLFSGIEIVLLCFWLMQRSHSKFSNAVVGGALISGGIFCAVIGCMLAPFSLLGLLLGIGILGFLPFVTAIVYLRNGWRALKADSNSKSTLTLITGFVCGALLVSSLSGLLAVRIHATVTKCVDDVVRTDPVRAPQAAHKLSLLKFVASADLDRIVRAYISETDPKRREILKSSYRQITGEDIDVKAGILGLTPLLIERPQYRIRS